MRTRMNCLALSLALSSAVGRCQSLALSDRSVSLSARIGAPINSAARIGIAGGIPGPPPVGVKFKYTGVTLANPNKPMPPNYIVVTPYTGTTLISATRSLGLMIGLNESVVRTMKPGTYTLEVNFSTVDEPVPAHASLFVDLHLSPPQQQPEIREVVNSASLQPSLSPGMLVSIFGANFGPPVERTSYDDTGTYPTALDDGEPPFGYTTVQFNGIAAALLSVSSGQIDAIVPYGLAGQESVDVVVRCYTRSSETFTLPVLDLSPAIFTATANGSGQGAVRNFSYSTGYSNNTVDSPAERGDQIEMFATGFGGFDPPVPDGTLSLVEINPSCAVTIGASSPECRRFIAEPISLTIGGKEAKISYVGPAKYGPHSRIHLRAWVPEDADSGEQRLVVTVGQRDNSQQQVTIAIR